MQCIRRFIMVLIICLFSVAEFTLSNACAAAMPQAGSATGSSAPITPLTPPVPQAASAPAQEGGTAAPARPTGATPADARAVAPPKANEGGYRDPDWGPRREFKSSALVPAFTGTYQPGEVFVSDAMGDVVIFQADGTMIGTLSSGQPLTAGMAFDRLGNLYVSTFGLPVGVVKFDVNGNLVGPFGNFPTADTGTVLPESVLISQAGNVIVGAATLNFTCPDSLTGPVPAFEFGPDGTLLNTITVAGECRGTDWVELLADQKTLLYTSEGTTMQSFDISANKQNAPFATGLPGSSAFAFRQLPDGTVLVADSTEAIRLRADGSILATYTPNPAVAELFALNLDPDGTSFWTADLGTGAIYRFDIASGTQLVTFTSPTGEASGLAIFAEKLAGNNNLTVTVNGSGTGTVKSTPAAISCPAMCVAPFTDNSSVTLTATAAVGSTLASFSANCVPATPQTNPPTCTVPIGTADVTVTATFNIGTNVTLTVTEAGTGTGTVTSAPAGINCPTTCAASFAGNSQVVLAALAGTNSTLANFSGNCAPATPQTNPPTCTVTMSANEAVTVTFNSTSGPSSALAITKSHVGNFKQGQHSAQYTVTVSNAANAAASNGTVTVTDTTLSTVAQDIATSFSGTANPNGVWSYGQYVEAPPAFSLLTGQNAGFPTCGLPYWSNSGYPDVIANNTGATVSCGTVTVPTDMLWLHPTNTGGTDAVVRWTAPASGTYEITGSYSALDSTSTTDSILVNGTSVFSTFICNPGNGKTCTTVNTLAPFAVVETLTAGSTVDFTVNCCTLPGQNFLFDSTGLTGAIDSNLSGLSLAAMFGQGWTCGPPSNAANVCTRSDALAPGASYPPITVLANVGVNAPSPQINMVTLSGGGSAPGSASDSAVINPSGTSAVLAITKSHVGNFTQGQQGATYAVTVSNGANAAPTSGAVTVTDTIPAGLTLVSMAGTNWTCTANSCTRSDALAAGASYPAITVTVNVANNAAAAVVNAVSVTGGGSATANATDPTTIAASSNATLTITESGSGTGTVTSAPAGINCPTTCAASFASGTQVVLTATPTNGSTFAGWGAGPCEGTGTCTLTISAATEVTANFTGGTDNFVLTVTETGTGSGTVTSAPAGINCPTACSANFASGAQVTLTQSAAEGSVFAGWGGACAGSGACVVNITAAKAVSATFNSSNSQVVITIPSGGSTTASTTPGGTAFFGLLITGAPGVTGTVQLSCSSPSAFITCTVVPSSITLKGGTAEVAFGIQTFCQGSAVATGFSVPGGFGGGGMGLFLATMLLGGIGFVFRRERRVTAAFAMVLILVTMGACASLPKSPSGQATPPGTYFISLTTTLNGQVQTLPNFLTLVVK